MTTLDKGDKAPNFSIKDQDGKTVKLSDFKGQKLFIYFYPADMTPTCTVQSCNLRDGFEELRSKGVAVLGVSPDDGASHQKFMAKHQLPFSLLADTDKKMIEEYGVWGEKNMYGKKYMGLIRTSFLIDEDGKIMRVFKKPKSKEHAAEVLKEL